MTGETLRLNVLSDTSSGFQNYMLLSKSICTNFFPLGSKCSKVFIA